MTKQKHYQDLVRHNLVKKLMASQILAVFSGNRGFTPESEDFR